LQINGLGKSYGAETLILGTEVGQGRAPKQQVFEFASEDISWKDEWLEFRQAVLLGKQPLANAGDNLEVSKALEALYKSAKLGKIININ